MIQTLLHSSVSRFSVSLLVVFIFIAGFPHESSGQSASPTPTPSATWVDPHADQLLLHYNFDDGTAKNLGTLGSAHDGVLDGDAQISSSGIQGNSLLVDGNGRIDLGHIPEVNFDGTVNFTVTAYARSTRDDRHQVVVGKGADISTRQWMVYKWVDNNLVGFVGGATSTPYLGERGAGNDMSHSCIPWYFVTLKNVVYLNGTAESSVYLDGRFIEAEEPNANPTTTLPIVIGARSNADETGYLSDFYGYIDDVRVYSWALEAEEIEALMVSQYEPTCTPTVSPTSSLTATNSITETVSPSHTITSTVSTTRTASHTATHSVTATNSITATVSSTNSISATVSSTNSISATGTTSMTSSETSTATESTTETSSSTSTVTLTPTSTSTVTTTSTTSVTSSPSVSSTSTESASLSSTSSETVSITSTVSETHTNTLSATLSSTVTESSTSSSTTTATVSVSVSSTSTVSPSISPTVSSTTSETTTISSTESVSVTTSVTSSPSLTTSVTHTSSLSSTVTETPSISSTVTESPSSTVSVTATSSTTVTSTGTLSPTETQILSLTPTVTQTESRTASNTPSWTAQPTPLIPNLRVTDARFRASGREVEIRFNTATDRALMYGEYCCSCGRLFHSATIAKIGSSATCRWESDTVHVVSLSPDATLKVFDTIALKPFRLRRKDSQLAFADGYPTEHLIGRSSAAFVLPTMEAYIVAPVYSCDLPNVRVGLSNIVGRVNYVRISEGTSTLFSRNYSSSTMIPSEVQVSVGSTSATSLSLQIYAVDVFGGVYSRTITAPVNATTSTASLYELYIHSQPSVGGSFKLYKDGLTLHARLRQRPCLTASSVPTSNVSLSVPLTVDSVSYLWTQTSGPKVLQTGSKTLPSLSIDSAAFDDSTLRSSAFGFRVTATVTATTPSDSAVIQSESLIIQPSAGLESEIPVSVVCTGGNTQISASSGSFVLDCSGTYDALGEGRVPGSGSTGAAVGDIEFLWSCEAYVRDQRVADEINTFCQLLNTGVALSNSAPTLQLPPNTLLPGLSYLFTVSAEINTGSSGSSNHRTSSLQLWVNTTQTLASVPLPLTVDRSRSKPVLARYMTAATSTRIVHLLNAQDAIRWHLQVGSDAASVCNASTLSVKWRVVERNVHPQSQTVKLFRSFSTTGSSSEFYLNLRPYAFEEGSEYTFQATVTPVAGTMCAALYTSNVVIIPRFRVNQRPSGGSCGIISPADVSTIRALETVVRIRCQGFDDDFVPAPGLYRYRHSYREIVAASGLAASDWKLLTYIDEPDAEVLLPAQTNGLIQIRTQVYDFEGGVGVHYFNVSVLPSTISSVPAFLQQRSNYTQTTLRDYVYTYNLLQGVFGRSQRSVRSARFPHLQNLRGALPTLHSAVQDIVASSDPCESDESEDCAIISPVCSTDRDCDRIHVNQSVCLTSRTCACSDGSAIGLTDTCTTATALQLCQQTCRWGRCTRETGVCVCYSNATGASCDQLVSGGSPSSVVDAFVTAPVYQDALGQMVDLHHAVWENLTYAKSNLEERASVLTLELDSLLAFSERLVAAVSGSDSLDPPGFTESSLASVLDRAFNHTLTLTSRLTSDLQDTNGLIDHADPFDLLDALMQQSNQSMVVSYRGFASLLQRIESWIQTNRSPGEWVADFYRSFSFLWSSLVCDGSSCSSSVRGLPVWDEFSPDRLPSDSFSDVSLQSSNDSTVPAVSLEVNGTASLRVLVLNWRSSASVTQQLNTHFLEHLLDSNARNSTGFIASPFSAQVVLPASASTSSARSQSSQSTTAASTATYVVEIPLAMTLDSCASAFGWPSARGSEEVYALCTEYGGYTSTGAVNHSLCNSEGDRCVCGPGYRPRIREGNYFRQVVEGYSNRPIENTTLHSGDSDGWIICHGGCRSRRESCSGHGECLSDGSGCSCDLGYVGSDCRIRVGCVAYDHEALTADTTSCRTTFLTSESITCSCGFSSPSTGNASLYTFSAYAVYNATDVESQRTFTLLSEISADSALFYIILALAFSLVVVFVFFHNRRENDWMVRRTQSHQIPRIPHRLRHYLLTFSLYIQSLSRRHIYDISPYSRFQLYALVMIGVYSSMTSAAFLYHLDVKGINDGVVVIAMLAILMGIACRMVFRRLLTTMYGPVLRRKLRRKLVRRKRHSEHEEKELEREWDRDSSRIGVDLDAISERKREKPSRKSRQIEVRKPKTRPSTPRSRFMYAIDRVRRGLGSRERRHRGDEDRRQPALTPIGGFGPKGFPGPAATNEPSAPLVPSHGSPRNPLDRFSGGNGRNKVGSDSGTGNPSRQRPIAPVPPNRSAGGVGRNPLGVPLKMPADLKKPVHRKPDDGKSADSKKKVTRIDVLKALYNRQREMEDAERGSESPIADRIGNMSPSLSVDYESPMPPRAEKRESSLSVPEVIPQPPRDSPSVRQSTMNTSTPRATAVESPRVVTRNSPTVVTANSTRDRENTTGNVGSSGALGRREEELRTSSVDMNSVKPSVGTPAFSPRQPLAPRRSITDIVAGRNRSTPRIETRSFAPRPTGNPLGEDTDDTMDIGDLDVTPRNEKLTPLYVEALPSKKVTNDTPKSYYDIGDEDKIFSASGEKVHGDMYESSDSDVEIVEVDEAPNYIVIWFLALCISLAASIGGLVYLYHEHAPNPQWYESAIGSVFLLQFGVSFLYYEMIDPFHENQSVTPRVAVFGASVSLYLVIITYVLTELNGRTISNSGEMLSNSTWLTLFFLILLLDIFIDLLVHPLYRYVTQNDTQHPCYKPLLHPHPPHLSHASSTEHTAPPTYGGWRKGWKKGWKKSTAVVPIEVLEEKRKPGWSGSEENRSSEEFVAPKLAKSGKSGRAFADHIMVPRVTDSPKPYVSASVRDSWGERDRRRNPQADREMYDPNTPRANIEISFMRRDSSFSGDMSHRNRTSFERRNKMGGGRDRASDSGRDRARAMEMDIDEPELDDVNTRGVYYDV